MSSKSRPPPGKVHMGKPVVWYKAKPINPNAPSALQKPPTNTFKVGKVPVKRKMLDQTPVAMANSTSSAKYAPPRKSNKRAKL